MPPTPPLAIDAFCCAGGSGMGWRRAGFRVIGVDVAPQPRYPFEFIQGDVFEVVPLLLRTHRAALLTGSPPCRDHTALTHVAGLDGSAWMLPAFRDMCKESGLPYVIENVPGAPMRTDVVLCGGMFGLRTYRHRWFETSLPLWAPEHAEHVAPQAKLGRPVADHEFIQVAGNFSGTDIARQAMGIDWMVRDELSQAIPPVYTTYLGTLARWLL